MKLSPTILKISTILLATFLVAGCGFFPNSNPAESTQPQTSTETSQPAMLQTDDPQIQTQLESLDSLELEIEKSAPAADDLQDLESSDLR